LEFTGNLGEPRASLGKRTRSRMNRENNIQALGRRLLDPEERSKSANSRYPGATAKREHPEKRKGSLSGFIVPIENRRTGTPGAWE